MSKKFYTVHHVVIISKDYEVWAESPEEAWKKIDDDWHDLGDYEYIDSEGDAILTDPETGDYLE